MKKPAIAADDGEQNPAFMQIDRRIMAAHRELMSNSPVSAVVLSVFAEYMDRSNAIIISYATLQELTGYSRASIGIAIKKLKADNWIQAVRVGTANVYVVNNAAFWTTGHESYSHFHATVVASATEQAVGIEQLNSVRLKRVPMLPDQTDMDLS